MLHFDGYFGNCFISAVSYYIFLSCHFYKGDTYSHLLICDVFCAVSVRATIYYYNYIIVFGITLEFFSVSNLPTII